MGQNMGRTGHQGTRWNLGSIHMPSKYEGQSFTHEAPVENLDLEYIFGFRGRDTRNAAHFLNANEIVYCVAATGVVYDRAANRQRFYRGHQDDIISIAVNPAKTVVATGQIGKDKGPQGAPPTVQLWDPRTMQKIGELRGHVNGIGVIAFSPDGRYILSVGQDDNYTLCVHDAATCQLINKQTTGTNKILGAKFDPRNPTQFVIVGVKVIKFGSIEGTNVVLNKGILGDIGEYQTFPTCDYLADGRAVVGTATGQVYVFNGRNLQKVRPAGTEPVNAMLALPDCLLAASGKSLVTFKNDTILSQGGKTEAPLVEGAIRSLALNGTELLYGTGKNELASARLDAASLQLSSPTMVMSGHFDETWGMAVHPTQPNIVVSCCDDGTIRMWDFVAQRAVDKIPVPQAGKSRVVDISPDGRFMVIGTENGKVYVMEGAGTPRPIANRTRQISEIKFSPDGRKLIVGNHESEVDVFSVPDFQKIGCLRGNSASITHADWSKDSAFVRTTAASGELLFWDLNTCTQVTRTSDLKDVEWATNHCIFGWPVQGIWPEASDITDINAVDLHPSGQLLAMGDDFRMVQLCRFPCVDKTTEKKKFNGHSEHVTNVRWAADGRRLISLGGLDAGVFVWSLH